MTRSGNNVSKETNFSIQNLGKQETSIKLTDVDWRRIDSHHTNIIMRAL